MISFFVICYKLVFNIGLALGAGYGAFQICMVLLNLATNALLMCKKATFFKIKVSMFFHVLGLSGGVRRCSNHLLAPFPSLR